jgi:PAS domain-containing protein
MEWIARGCFMTHEEEMVPQLSSEIESLRRRVQELEVLGAAAKATEEALHDAEMRFRSLVESPVYAIVTLDQGSRITFWNRAVTNMFEYSEPEVLGKPISILIPEMAENARGVQIRQCCGDGSQVP